MSIASQITRIQQDRNTIRNKLVELGLASGTDNLDVLAESIDSIVDNGNVTVNVKEGETYTIPAGYHSGSGTVSGIAGGGNYSLQSKSVTPTKKTQNITSDDGYYGLSDVSVAPIPDAYQDVTAVTAAAGDVLTGKTIVSSTGQILAGSMPNNGAVTKTLTTADASYTVPAGYHNGTGKVQIVPEDKTVTPTKSAQDITATAGKVLNKVSVAAIPAEYQVVTGVTATADKVLTGSKFVDSTGAVIDGTMANNGAVSKTLNTTTTSYTVPQGYHDGKGAINITLEEKSVTPTKSAQNVTPTNGKVLSKVSVAAIPAEYQVVTEVDAVANDVISGKKIVAADGTVVTGNLSLVNEVLTFVDEEPANVEYVANDINASLTIETTPIDRRVALEDGAYVRTWIPGEMLGDVTAAEVAEGKTFTSANGLKVEGTLPVKTENIAGAGFADITEEGIGMFKVTSTSLAGDMLLKQSATVGSFIYTSEFGDVTAAEVLVGKTFTSEAGLKIEGSMPNNGDTTATIDGLTTMSVTIPAGYTTGGTVSLTSDIEDALAAI